jgi:hypothetical protein
LPSYADDQDARGKHAGEIPWFKDILLTTPITNAGGVQLGTGSVDFNKIAANNISGEAQVLSEPSRPYQGKVCDEAIPKKNSWHPGGGSTIMEKIASGLGAPLEKIVERLLVSKGARKKCKLMGRMTMRVLCHTRKNRQEKWWPT